MSSLTTRDDDVPALDFAALAELRDEDVDGPQDHVCPLCGPDRREPCNRTRPTLRTWEPDRGFITYCCARCEAKGWARATAEQMTQPPVRRAAPPPAAEDIRKVRLEYATWLWEEASSVLSADARAYFRWRGIVLDDVPKGVLRVTAKQPLILARFTDAITEEPRGIWRRSPDGQGKPMTLGPMAGCVIRLWPKSGRRLVIAEGVETALAAATRVSHRGRLLRPAWATGCANNLRRMPVIDGVEELIILVDNDESGTGQKAAAECAERWCDAGRRVIRLMPRKLNTDFNDLVMP